jgi:hypothetical protein
MNSISTFSCWSFRAHLLVHSQSFYEQLYLRSIISLASFLFFFVFHFWQPQELHLCNTSYFLFQLLCTFKCKLPFILPDYIRSKVPLSRSTNYFLELSFFQSSTEYEIEKFSSSQKASPRLTATPLSAPPLPTALQHPQES